MVTTPWNNCILWRLPMAHIWSPHTYRNAYIQNAVPWDMRLCYSVVNHLRVPCMMGFYRPQQSCGQGYVFTRVCDSVHRGGVCLSACWDTATPRGRHPPKEGGTPKKETPREGEPPKKEAPPKKETPLPRRPPCQGDLLPGPHPRGKLRGIRSRPTPKGEI